MLDRKMLFRLIAMAVLGLALGSGIVADEAPPPPSEPANKELPAAGDTQPAETPAGTKHALILCGLPGDKAHEIAFAETIEKLRQSLVARCGFAGADVHVQFGGLATEGAGSGLTGIQGKGTREEIASEAAELRKALKPQDILWVIVMGHAYYDGKHSHFNIPGPDMNEQEFGKLFAGMAAREQVFFITIPASGFYIKPLSAKGRVVITATEADRGGNETVFPMALAEVLTNPPQAADFDVDGDGRATLFDFYIVVTLNVIERYLKDEFLPTEHALLDDNGDGRGKELQIDYLTEAQGGRAKAGRTPPPPKKTADGALSSRCVLWP